jgi:hypothetical protein
MNALVYSYKLFGRCLTIAVSAALTSDCAAVVRICNMSHCASVVRVTTTVSMQTAVALCALFK